MTMSNCMLEYEKTRVIMFKREDDLNKIKSKKNLDTFFSEVVTIKCYTHGTMCLPLLENEFEPIFNIIFVIISVFFETAIDESERWPQNSDNKGM